MLSVGLKKYRKLLFLVLVLCLITIFMYTFLSDNGTHITIQNTTNDKISGLSLSSTWGDRKTIEQILPGEQCDFTYKLGPANENALILSQNLNGGQINDYTIKGYVSGIENSIYITIMDIDENKNMIIKVSEDD